MSSPARRVSFCTQCGMLTSHRATSPDGRWFQCCVCVPDKPPVTRARANGVNDDVWRLDLGRFLGPEPPPADDTPALPKRQPRPVHEDDDDAPALPPLEPWPYKQCKYMLCQTCDRVTSHRPIGDGSTQWKCRACCEPRMAPGAEPIDHRPTFIPTKFTLSDEECHSRHAVAQYFDDRPYTLSMRDASDRYYEDATALYRVPASSNWPFGRIRPRVNRLNEGKPRRGHDW